MDIEGTYTLQAPTEEVWACLMDQQTIQHTIPGLERLTRVDDHTYTFAITVRHAPLRGSYTGRASILDANYPSAYRLKIEGEGPANEFLCDASIKLSAHNENTVVSYQGTLQPGRNNARISAPLIKATVKVLLQQFFTTLADRLRTERENPVYVTTLEEMYEIPFMEEQISSQLVERYQEGEAPTLLHQLVRRLGLGRHDPAQEEQWVRRLRQVGVVAVLLLLVWVGTRLPRRAVM
ncbi:MAG TPA: carbon monoxide dehydrogenase subunit G [Ktedonobacteraceae bacterium]|jgi:carbon monoxide dehydrogenase subunit G|nr:carbon monoxide dehydrogenase subunit G [Ktedonobacteraceae bacterium]